MVINLYILILLLIFQAPLYYFLIITLPTSVSAVLYSIVLSGEFFIFLGIFLLFTNKIYKKLQFVSTIFLFLLIFFYHSIVVSQTYSLYLINSYIPAAGFLNKESINLFITPKTLILITLLTIVSVLLTHIIIKISKKQKQFHKKNLIIPLIFIAAGIEILILFGDRTNFSKLRQINGPVVEFFEQNRLSKKLSSRLEKDIIMPKVTEKSWIKDTVYTSDKEFINNSEQPNIIILIPDGVPARLINGYQKLWGNSENPLNDLTPAIDMMMKNSFVIDNYYNHTAATFPGLAGMFTSTFPFRGILPQEIKKILSNIRPAPNFSSIFDILKLSNYADYFILSDSEAIYTPQLMRDVLKINTVYSPDNIKEINSNAPAFQYLNENEIFETIKNILLKNMNKPIMLGAYFTGTHLNVSPLDFNGIAYKENANIFLSALHNFDYELGKFMDWLKTSAFANNTLVILTSDHTHYPDKEMQELLKKHPSLAKNFQPYFTDIIPFVIYNTHNLPDYHDAKSKTSLYFAPTLLHILGHKNYRNAFLAGSIFDEEKPAEKPYFYIDAFNTILCIKDNHIYDTKTCEQYENFNQKLNQIKVCQQLEAKGLLFDNQY